MTRKVRKDNNYRIAGHQSPDNAGRVGPRLAPRLATPRADKSTNSISETPADTSSLVREDGPGPMANNSHGEVVGRQCPLSPAMLKKFASPVPCEGFLLPRSSRPNAPLPPSHRHGICPSCHRPPGRRKRGRQEPIALRSAARSRESRVPADRPPGSATPKPARLRLPTRTPPSVSPLAPRLAREQPRMARRPLDGPAHGPPPPLHDHDCRFRTSPRPLARAPTPGPPAAAAVRYRPRTRL